MPDFTSNHLIPILQKLHICKSTSFITYYPETRDRKDVSVVKCQECGLITLSTTKHITNSYYADQPSFTYWNAASRIESVNKTSSDDSRRFKQFGKLLKKANWLDVGTGNGGLLDLVKPYSKSVYGVEPQTNVRRILTQEGYQMYATIKDAPSNFFNYITLFHVLEHMSEPLEDLSAIFEKLRVGGKVIVEVPHSQDALLTLYDVDAFKKHTFWSEHLLLHTVKSLKAFLAASGFKKIKVLPYQRYPLVNHLYWLRYGKPGGQNIWSEMRDTQLEANYAKKLQKMNKTDTLIAIAEKN